MNDDSGTVTDTTTAGEEQKSPELLALQQQCQEYLEGWQRARADFVNYKKDQEKLLAQLEQAVEGKMLADVLPLADGFVQAFSHHELVAGMAPALRTGFEQLRRELEKFLEQHQLVAFGAVGDLFDPNLHSAVATEETSEPEKDHTIAVVHTCGYRRGAQVIRPALVVVWQKS